MPICGGCGAVLVTEGGYQRHLAMTRNRTCREYLDRQFMDIDNDRDERPFLGCEDFSDTFNDAQRNSNEQQLEDTDNCSQCVDENTAQAVDNEGYWPDSSISSHVSPDDQHFDNFEHDNDEDNEGGQILEDSDIEPEGRPADMTVEAICLAASQLSLETMALDAGAMNETTETDASATDNESEFISVQSRYTRAACQLHIERLTNTRAGEPLEAEQPEPQKKHAYEVYQDCLQLGGSETNVWAPFKSELDWEIARWAKLRGPGSTAVSELLSINGIQDTLGLSYKNSRELNKIIDSELPGLPRFQWKQVKMGEKSFDIYFRDPLKCIEALLSAPDLCDELLLVPERQYSDETKKEQWFHEINTGRWWWETQKTIECDKPGATIVPVILSSDKTQVTMFRSKQAYPVYLTIGNIPKDIRCKPSHRAQVLLAYLPTTKLDHISNLAARRRMLANLFHACMHRILQPLQAAGKEGVKMRSGDGVLRRVHPIVAIYACDYPEQLLVTCIKTGECPKCLVGNKELGSPSIPLCYRDLAKILDILHRADEDLVQFTKDCSDNRIKPVIHPFWEELPYVNIYQSITPDVLHQIYQGIVKHIFSWVISIYGAREIDARCKCFPPNHNIRIFSKGISTLSRLTGQEHNQMCRFLLGLITGAPLPPDLRNPERVVRAIRAILDFIYLAQLPVHSTTTLDDLEAALSRFHANMDVFIDLNIRTNMNLPKLHALRHYAHSIRNYGTIDNYNTEYTERLHIDLTKEAHRATNQKDEYVQMTTWLERKDKIVRHDKYIHWRISGSAIGSTLTDRKSVLPDITPKRVLKMAQHPSICAVTFDSIVNDYGATYFRAALARYVTITCNPNFTRCAQVEQAASGIHFYFSKLPVFHKIRFCATYKQSDGETKTFDSIHARPAKYDERRRVIPGRFDMVLVWNGRSEREKGVVGHRVGQVRVIFTIPERAASTLFSDGIRPERYLAYVEWFTDFPDAPDNNTRLYKLRREIRDQQRLASVIPVYNICQSIHLYPQFGKTVPGEWTSDNVLEKCTVFYVNPFSDRLTYLSVF